MKKILSLMLVLLMLVGCMPTHHTETAIMFKDDFSGELVLKAELETDYLEDPIDEIEEKVTKIVEGIDKFKEGKLETKSESKKLTFTYTEQFKDLESLSTILTRIYEEDVKIEFNETESLFRNEKHLEGFDFDAKGFTDAIYDAIEKDSVFGENSKEAREYQEGYSFVELYLNDEYMSAYENFSDDDYRNIESDTLFIDIIDNEYVNLMNVIVATEDLDLDELEDYYEDRYNDRVLSRESNAEFSIDKNAKTRSLTISLENAAYKDIEDLEYDIFSRMIEFSVADLPSSNGKNNQFEIDVYDMGHTIEFEDIVLNREVNIDVSGYKIVTVDDEPFQENAIYDFKVDGSMIHFEEGAYFSMTLEESSMFSLNSILKYIVIAIIALLVLVATFFIVKNVRDNKNDKPESDIEEKKNSVDTDASLEKTDTVNYELVSKNKVFEKNEDVKFSKNIQSAIFNVSALRHAGIMLVIVIILTVLTTLLSNALFADNLMNTALDSGMFELDTQTKMNAFEAFRMMFAWVSTGGFSISLSGGLGDILAPVALNFNAFINPLIISVLVPLISVLISTKVFKFKSLKERNTEIMSGTLWYGIIVAIIAFIPIATMSDSADIFSYGVTIRGNGVSAAFIVLPLYLLITYVLLTWKQRFSTANIKVSCVVHDAFIKFLILLGTALIAAVVIVLVNNDYPIVLLGNIAGIVLILGSGMIFEGHNIMEATEIGILNPNQYMWLIVLAIIIYIGVILFNLKKIYYRNNIVDKNKFSLVYTLALTLPVYLVSALSGISISLQMYNISYRMNYPSMFLSFIVTLLLVFIRVQLIKDDHPLEHIDESLSMESNHDEVEVIEVYEEHVDVHKIAEKARPMSGRRHRRRLR